MKKFSLPKDGGLIEAGLPNGVKHTFERIPAHIFEDEDVASERIAEKIAESINACNGVYRLGFSTGSSLIGIYRSLVRRYEAGELSFKNVEIYSTDEYYDNHQKLHYPSIPGYPSTSELSFQYLPQTANSVPNPIPSGVW